MSSSRLMQERQHICERGIRLRRAPESFSEVKLVEELYERCVPVYRGKRFDVRIVGCLVAAVSATIPYAGKIDRMWLSGVRGELSAEATRVPPSTFEFATFNRAAAQRGIEVRREIGIVIDVVVVERRRVGGCRTTRVVRRLTVHTISHHPRRRTLQRE